jgi:hypothetical protein
MFVAPSWDMAIMATQTATSSKKAESHDSSHDEHDARRARPGDAGKRPDPKGPHKPPSAAAESVDDTLENPYDNVACTD